MSPFLAPCLAGTVCQPMLSPEPHPSHARSERDDWEMAASDATLRVDHLSRAWVTAAVATDSVNASHYGAAGASAPFRASTVDPECGQWHGVVRPQSGSCARACQSQPIGPKLLKARAPCRLDARCMCGHGHERDRRLGPRQVGPARHKDRLVPSTRGYARDSLIAATHAATAMLASARATSVDSVISCAVHGPVAESPRTDLSDGPLVVSGSRLPSDTRLSDGLASLAPVALNAVTPAVTIDEDEEVDGVLYASYVHSSSVTSCNVSGAES